MQHLDDMDGLDARIPSKPPELKDDGPDAPVVAAVPIGAAGDDSEVIE